MLKNDAGGSGGKAASKTLPFIPDAFRGLGQPSKNQVSDAQRGNGPMVGKDNPTTGGNRQGGKRANGSSNSSAAAKSKRAAAAKLAAQKAQKANAAAKAKAAAKKPAPKPSTSKPSTSKGGSGVSGATGSPKGATGSSSGSKSSSSSKSTSDKTDYLKKAQDAVNLELQPQIDAIKRAMDKLTGQADTSARAAETRGANTQTDLDAVYQRLDSYLKDRQAVGQQGYQDTAGKVDQNFAAQQGQMQQNSVNANSQVSQELERMGITSPNQDYTQRMKADDSFLSGLAGSNRAQAASSLGAQQANAMNVQGLLQGDSQASGAQQKGTAYNALSEALNSIMQSRNEGVNDYNSQIASIQGQSGKMVQQMLDAYESQAYQRQQDAQQQDFENSMATNNFNLNVDKLNSQNAYNASKVKIEKAKIQAAKETAAQKAGTSTSTAASKINGGQYKMGSLGAMDFIGKWITDPKLKAAFAAAMQRVDNNTDPGLFNQTDYKSKPVALGIAAKVLADMGGLNTPENSQWLSDMLDVYWGKYGG